MASTAYSTDDERHELTDLWSIVDEQVHHSEHGFFRIATDGPLADRSTVDCVRILRAAADELGLPTCLPVPPSCLPGNYNDKPDEAVMDIIREGVRYALAIAKGEKRTLWNIHNSIQRKLREQFQAGVEDLIERQIAKEAAERRKLDAQARERIKNTLVYFIQADWGGPIKIGMAVSPEKRLRELQTSHASKLVLLATCPGGQKQEAAYHKQFAEHRLHGEWFSPHPDILSEVSLIRGGQA